MPITMACGSSPPSQEERSQDEERTSHNDAGEAASLADGSGRAAGRPSRTCEFVVADGTTPCGEPMGKRARFAPTPTSPEVLTMRRLISVVLLSGFATVFAMAAYAQSTSAPKGPADCKVTEKWDAATKTCKPK